MKAIQLMQTGGPEWLKLAELPSPSPKANEALIEIMRHTQRARIKSPDRVKAKAERRLNV